MEKTLVSLLDKRVQDTPDQVYLKFREENGAWQEMTWRDYGRKINRLSKALMGYGIKQGDKISLIGPGSPKWFVTDMSAMTMGAVVAPIYITSSGDQIAYIVNHSGARLLFVDDISYFQRIEPVISKMPGLEKVVLLNGSAPSDIDMLTDLPSFEKLCENVTDDELTQCRNSVTENMAATYIYTSGTTGNPKAVILSQKNYFATAQSVSLWQKFLTEDNTIPRIKHICFLTLAHVFERNLSMTAPLSTGACVYFGDLSNAMEDLKQIQPTILVALPRIWEKMYEGIMAYKAQMPAAQQEVFDQAISTGKTYNMHLYEKTAISPQLKEEYEKAYDMVIARVLDVLGCFKDARHIMTGGAVSSRKVIDFFFSIGIWICQVYGQTESLGMGSAETRDFLKFGSVGKAFPFSEVKTADDGEILIKSDMVSPGYHNEPELNETTFKDGWLYTGDVGFIDSQGYLFITGRKKDIIITSGAKNITPAKIEGELMRSPLIEHAVVVGEGKKYLTALLTLSLEGGKAWAGNRGEQVDTYTDLLELDLVAREIDTHVARVNEKFSRVEQIKKFSILAEPLTEEHGELTALQKLKRFKVIENNDDLIEKMYA